MVWDMGKFLSVLPFFVVEQILLVLISGIRPDRLRWDLSRDEDFSLRSAWEFIHRSRIWNDVLSFIWQQHILSRVSFCL